eukprot:COSAG06_NODE_8991_length_2017_cov_3.830553_3_plen_51_part_01
MTEDLLLFAGAQLRVKGQQKTLTDEEKREKAEKAERLAAARAEAKAEQAEA